MPISTSPAGVVVFLLVLELATGSFCAAVESGEVEVACRLLREALLAEVRFEAVDEAVIGSWESCERVRTIHPFDSNC